jgi:hypothetical protein
VALVTIDGDDMTHGDFWVELLLFVIKPKSRASGDAAVGQHQ